MEGTRCEEIETTNEIESKIKTESSIEINSTFYVNDGKLAELDSELQEDFCAVMERIKYEKTEVAEEIEPAPLPETYEIPRSEQDMKFCRIIFESIDYNPLMSFCRLCATQSNSMVYMFSQNELQNNIIEKIEYCFSNEVKKTDTLPKQVCSLCLEKLELCYQFHKTVEAAEEQFLTFYDDQCNEEKYKSFFDQDSHSNIIRPQAILQELPQIGTETLGNSNTLSNSKLQKETYHINKPNEDSRMESSSDQDQSTCNSLLTFPLHTWNDMEEKLEFNVSPITPESYGPRIINRHQDSDSLHEETRYDNSDNDIVVRGEVFNKRTLAEQNIVGQELIRCQNCRETFETVDQCLTHSSIHASKSYFPCCLCDRTFGTTEDCDKHRLEHKESENLKSGNKPPDKYLREAKLKAKIKEHCETCTEDIDSETSLDERRQHMLTVHKQQNTSEQLIALQSKGDFSFECKLCYSRFHSNYELAVHKNTNCSSPLVSMEKKFSCMFCGKKFYYQHIMKVHLRIHTGERPYGCDVCGKMFRDKRNRDSHRLLHTGEKPFKCSKCEKRFTTAGKLKGHSVVHSDERPYQCQLCPYRSKTSRARTVHMRIHAGEKRFKCSKCEKKFTSAPSLRFHCLRYCKGVLYIPKNKNR